MSTGDLGCLNALETFETRVCEVILSAARELFGTIETINEEEEGKGLVVKDDDEAEDGDIFVRKNVTVVEYSDDNVKVLDVVAVVDDEEEEEEAVQNSEDEIIGGIGDDDYEDESNPVPMPNK